MTSSLASCRLKAQRSARAPPFRRTRKTNDLQRCRRSGTLRAKCRKIPRRRGTRFHQSQAFLSNAPRRSSSSHARYGRKKHREYMVSLARLTICGESTIGRTALSHQKSLQALSSEPRCQFHSDGELFWFLAESGGEGRNSTCLPALRLDLERRRVARLATRYLPA